MKPLKRELRQAFLALFLVGRADILKIYFQRRKSPVFIPTLSAGKAYWETLLGIVKKNVLRYSHDARPL